ncbi:urease accessory protein UreD [Citrobacter freundii]|uniref:urease accessory protein UreD n=1 Tax=Citrobacter TaxID=544 RepID=UPI00214DB46C|nr:MULTISPECIES: urease accessory protein UreD [Citrobacter]EKT9260800.1 urease accessory protein UreD [Citrobacter freundii]EKU4729949.1 urease accessory protein UreD [Citrobacter freundii]EKV2293369.1 urease accessory protein UreD [Citrobacter freundii]EKW0766649.1 urease accessory protein UreD [Citrobacter freundii]MCR3681204.1 urease accessory protein UreD [Citrobacter freundii]
MDTVAHETLTRGWQAELELHFSCTGHKTVLASARHHGPLTVQRPFYPEEDVCHLYLLHPPAGIVGGDELHIAVTLDENSHALITQPGAGKFYRSRGPQALLRQHFTLASHATLEWLPQDTILFPGANAAIQTVFHLTSASRLLAWDLLCLGRPVMQETFSHGMLQNRLEVWRDGQPLLIERLILQEGNLSGVAHHPWVGTLLCYPANEHMLEGTRERLMALGDYAGATLNDSLLTIRFLANDNLVVQRVIRDIWQFLRPLLTHKTPVLPRIWQT